MKLNIHLKKFFIVLSLASVPALFADAYYPTVDPRYAALQNNPLATLEQPGFSAQGGVCNPAANPVYAPIPQNAYNGLANQYNVPGGAYQVVH